MKKIYFLLALVGLCFASCKDNHDISLSPKHVVGIWRMYSEVNGEKTPLNTWYRFSQDNKSEVFLYTDQSQYVYCQGTYHITDNTMVVQDQQERIYQIHYQLLRCMAEFNESQIDWPVKTFVINAVSDSVIDITEEGASLWLVRQQNLPDIWREECSEPDIEASAKTLAGQWDLRSYYALNGGSYQGWSLEKPETQGMVLTEQGEFTFGQFWINSIVQIERKAGHLANNDQIYVYYNNCAWETTKTMLTMVCTSYDKIQVDQAGNETARETITVPVIGNYTIHRCTKNWLTLYSAIDNLYFSFHRNPTNSAPQQTAAK